MPTTPIRSGVVPAGGPQSTPPGHLSVIVTYLEMPAAPDSLPPAAPALEIEVVRVSRPSVRFYRSLYDTVGEPWLWSERRALSDRALGRIIQDPRVDIYVLMCDGRQAGYGELDRRPADDIGLAYFGLFPAYVGRGLGPWLLDQVVAAAWNHQPRRLCVNTCSFDHPRALGLYISRGFVPVRHVQRLVPDPRLTGLLPRTAAPQIPLAREG